MKCTLRERRSSLETINGHRADFASFRAVVGINTLTLSGTHGIGFAIPIEAVHGDFTQLHGRRSD